MKTLCALVLLAAPALYAETPSAVAIRNARIVPVSGPTIPKGTVVVRDGLIEEVGANVNVPADAWIVDGDGLTVYPGLIDSLSTLGIADAAPAATATGGRGGGRGAAAETPAVNNAPQAHGPEDRPSTNSWLRAADLVKPSDRRLESARAEGFTTSVTFPPRGIFAGKGAVVDLAGERGGDMVVVDDAGQYLTFQNGGFGGGFPGSLMGVIAYIRQVYVDADHYKKAKEFYAAHPRGMQRPEYDRALEGVLESPRVLIPATRRIDVDRYIRFANELKVHAVLYGLHEGYKSADLLKTANTPVLVSLKWPEKPRDSDPEDIATLQVLELREKSPSTPAVLAKNGVHFALYADGIERRAELYRAVKRAIDAGLSPDDAVRAMTIWPAEIYGVSDRLGSIEKGKIANLTVTKGDLFQDRTEVKYVFIDGLKYEPIEEPPSPPGGRGAAPSEPGENQ